MCYYAYSRMDSACLPWNSECILVISTVYHYVCLLYVHFHLLFMMVLSFFNVHFQINDVLYGFL